MRRSKEKVQGKDARRRSKRGSTAVEGAFHLKQANKNLSRAKQKTQMKQRKNEVFPSLHTDTQRRTHTHTYTDRHIHNRL